MITLLAATALIAGSGQMTPTRDAVSEARTFLETFMTNPQATKDMVTSDALLVAHDIGGRYAEFLSGLHSRKLLPAGCAVQSLEQKPGPPETKMHEYPAPSFKASGHFELVVGAYACPGQDGKTQLTDVTIYLKDGRVLLFAIEPRRNGA